MAQLRDRRQYDVHPAEMENILRDLFPQDPDAIQAEVRNGELLEPFTREELVEAAGKMKNKKAPGPDGVWPESVKIAVRAVPDMMLEAMNGFARNGTFPDLWKEALVVLIPKGESKYRPISLISTIGKLFEHLIKIRLEAELEARGALAQTQYGFRKGRSTIDAIQDVLQYLTSTQDEWAALILIDVKNAFNTAKWRIIQARLAELGVSRGLRDMLGSYLYDRRIVYGKKRKLTITQGVPQGSILGPTLWNVLYDGVLRLELPDNCRAVAYADDLALAVRAANGEDLMHRADEALFIIQMWLRNHGLEVAAQKTEAVIVKGKRNRGHIRFEVGDAVVRHTRAAKYLGVWVDSRLSFGQHIKECTAKANKLTTAVARLMPNMANLTTNKRRLLYGVTQSVMTYAAPIWSGAMRMERYRRMALSAQRKGLLRVACAYRTVSANAVQVITGVVPFDLLVEERKRQWEDPALTRTANRAITIDRWQERWASGQETAQWTKRLIPDLQPWLQCKHRRVDYFLTQFLSGHGAFRSYVKRIGKTNEDLCLYCRQSDTPEHGVLHCPKWTALKAQLEVEVGQNIRAENIISVMISSKTKWDRISNYVREVVKSKEELERREMG